MDFYENESTVNGCRNAVLSEDTYDFITDFPLTGFRILGESFCYANVEDMYNIIYLDQTLLANVPSDSFQYQSIPKVYGLQDVPTSGTENADPFVASGIPQVQRAPLNLTGRGCIVCLIDTGIDYTSNLFRTETGESRILAIWDQTVSAGSPPEGFLYGSEYTRAQINEALRSDNPYAIVPSRDEIGHGTAYARVAAGNGTVNGARFVGAAPEADLVVVKLKPCKQYLRSSNGIPEGIPAYQENDIMLAVQYADSFTNLLSRPVIICLGLCTNSGDHAGSSALSRYLNDVAIRRSRGVVVGGGNEGNAAHHYRGNLMQNFTQEGIVEVRVGENVGGFVLECWSNLPDILQVGIRSPEGETIPAIRISDGQSFTYRLIYSNTLVRLDATVVEASSGEQLLRFFLQNPTPGIWTFQVGAVGTIYNGVFDMWLPIRQFVGDKVIFLRPDPYVTLTEPAMAANVIAVADYNASNGSLAIDSGRGFSRTGTVRPDLSAPGIAAAITAGAVAQLLQWAVVQQRNYYAETRELKSYLIRGASRSADLNYPSREWGYGKLDMEGVFEVLTGV